MQFEITCVEDPIQPQLKIHRPTNSTMNMKTLVIVMTLAFGMADVSHTSSKLRAKLGLGKLSEISSLRSAERSGSLSGKYELNDGSKVGVEFDDEGVSAVALNMTKRCTYSTVI